MTVNAPGSNLAQSDLPPCVMEHAWSWSHQRNEIQIQRLTCTKGAD